ncbi:MAG: hypothetical protein KF680_11125 [Cryobacterium sp.]|nr:hypothetical protein [Cryobacterium sp.]
MVEPGRLLTLDTDEQDATSILRVVHSLGEVGDVLGRALHNRVLKEVLWFRWEQPRLPRPLVDGKYPHAYPWSAEARRVWQESPRREGRRGALVIEHTEPKRELLARIIRAGDAIDVAELLSLLRDAHSAVVITKREDDLVTRAGFSHRSPDPSDVWARYRAAGLEVEGFAPLNKALTAVERR